MANDKQVVERQVAAAVAAAPAAVAPETKPKAFRFRKTINPVETVKAGGQEIKWYRKALPNGQDSPWGEFVTDDEKVAADLRKLAKERPCFSIFEV